MQFSSSFMIVSNIIQPDKSIKVVYSSVKCIGERESRLFAAEMLMLSKQAKLSMKLTNIASVLFVLVTTSLSTGGAQTEISKFQICTVAEFCYYRNINVSSVHLSSPANSVATLPNVCPEYLQCIKEIDAITVVDRFRIKDFYVDGICPLLSPCQASSSLPDTLTWDLYATWMCPDTELCGTNSNAQAQMHSCCSPCSCSPDCGRHYECCFTDDDKFNIIETENMNCFPLETTIGTLSLYMISTCPNGQQCLKPDESILPVSSSATKRIYATSTCAICNQVFVYRKWNLLTRCNGEHMDMYEILQILYQGNMDCHSAIMLPSNDSTWINRFICNEIQSCEPSFQNQAVIKACKVTRAPFIYSGNHDNVTVYRNVHCAMCNIATYTRLIDNSICDLGRFSDYKYFHEHVMILDIDLIDSFTESSSSAADIPSDTCKEGDVVINREKIKCFSVLCAHGMMLDVDGRCRYFILTIQKSSFQIHFKLVPVAMVAASSLKALVANRPVDDWLQSKCPLMTQGGATDVHILSTEQNGKDIVTELSVSIMQMPDNIQLEKLIKDARSCLEESWTATPGDTSFDFEIDFEIELANRYIKANTHPNTPGGLSGVRHHRSYFVLTKLYFCDQVELALEDIEMLDDEVKMIHNNKTLGNNEYDIINSTDDSDSYHVRVCLDDFKSHVENIMWYWKTDTRVKPDGNVPQRISSGTDNVSFVGLLGTLYLIAWAIMVYFALSAPN